MARVTVEDCLDHVGDRFSLVQIAAQRVRMLKKGSGPTIRCDNREIVTALREIAAKNVLLQPADESAAVEEMPETTATEESTETEIKDEAPKEVSNG